MSSHNLLQYGSKVLVVTGRKAAAEILFCGGGGEGFASTISLLTMTYVYYGMVFLYHELLGILVPMGSLKCVLRTKTFIIVFAVSKHGGKRGTDESAQALTQDLHKNNPKHHHLQLTQFQFQHGA